MDIRYHRFDQNLGGTDLAAHWNRCVQLCRAEWIWLFSDDDTADPDCVEKLLDRIDSAPGADVLAFDSRTVDAQGSVTKTHPPLPVRESAMDYLLGRLRGTRESFVPDHVFRRDRWLEIGGFHSYPLAWYADDAFWLEMARKSGIHAVGATISWRKSGTNLSSVQPSLARRKYEALCQYDNWLASTGWFQQLVDRSSLDLAGMEALRRDWFWKALRALGVAFPPTVWRELQSMMDPGFPQSRPGQFVFFSRVWLHRILHSAR